MIVVVILAAIVVIILLCLAWHSLKLLEGIMSAIDDAIVELNTAIEGVKTRVAEDTATLLARIDALVASEALAEELGAELAESVTAIGTITDDLNTIDPVPDVPEP